MQAKLRFSDIVVPLRVRGVVLALALLGATAMPSFGAAVTVTATKEATTANGPGGSTTAGGTIDYKVTITNSGTVTLTSVSLTDAAPAHTADVGSFKVSPLAFPDAYNAIKNTLLHINAPGVLANDKGVPSPTAVPIAGGPTTGGGTITLNADGSFDYTPLTGFTGTDTFTYTATNTQPPNDTATVTITVQAPPAFTSADNVTFTANVLPAPFSITTSGIPTVTSITKTGTLPAGVSFVYNNDGTATLSGKPNVGQGGVYPLVFTASNGVPPDATQNFTLTVNEGPTAHDDPTAGIPSNSSPGSNPYHIAINTSISSGSSPNLLTNDALGQPAATVSSFGPSTGLETTVASNTNGATAAGGTLKVLANGSFNYTPPSATFTGLDSFKYTITNTIGSSTATVSLAVGVRPVAANDTYPTTLIGNVKIDTTVSSNFSVLSNDTGDQQTAVLVGIPTGGTVTLNSNGTFIFNPNPGFSGPASFNYKVHNGFGDSGTTATVGLTVSSSRIWFVKSDAASNGDGRLGTPFNVLSSVVSVDAASDNIFLYSSATNYTGPITLEASEKLIGGGASATLAAITGLTFPADSGTPPATGGTRPTIATGGITLGTSNTIRGLNVSNTTAAKIIGTAFGTVLIGDNSTPDIAVSGTGKALDLVNGTFAATSGFVSVASTGTAAGQHGLKLDTIHGTVSFGSTTINNSAIQGIFVFGSDVDVNFGDTTVGTVGTANSGGGGGAEGVRLESNLTGGAHTFTFGKLTISESAAQGLTHGGAGGGGRTVVTGTTTINNPGATGILVNVAAASNGITFANVNVTGSGGVGVTLTDNVGPVTFADLDISPDSGQKGLVISNTAAGTRGTVTATSGTISALSASGVEVTGFNTSNLQPLALVFDSVSSTGGTNNVLLTNVSGSIAMNGGALSLSSGVAFSVSGSTATVSYAGSITNVTGGISLTNNTGGTITFLGGMSLSTGATTAFNATGGGTVNVCDENPCDPAATGALVNTLTTTTATALNVANTTIGLNNLEFKSITAGTGASGPASGIILNTTGSSGGLKVKGDGASARNGSGGTIQKTSGDGVSLTSTQGVQLTHMNINNSGTNGIFGSQVNGFVSDWNSLSGNGNAVNEGGIRFGGTLDTDPTGLTGGAIGSATETRIDNTVISNSLEHGLVVENTSGTLTQLNLTVTTIQNDANGSGFLIETRGAAGSTAAATAQIEGSSFLNNPGSGVNGNALRNTTLTINILGNAAPGTNTFTGHDTILLGNGDTSHLVADIRNNTISGNGNGIFVGNAVSATSGATLSAKIVSNNVTTNAGGANHSISSFMSGGTSHLLIDSNIVVNNGQSNGINIGTPDDPSGPIFTAKVLTNTVTNGGSAANGISLSADVSGPGATAVFKVESNTVNWSAPSVNNLDGIFLNQFNSSTVSLERGTSASNTASVVLPANNPNAHASGAGGAATTVSGTVTVVANGTITLPLLAQAGGVEAATSSSKGQLLTKVLLDSSVAIGLKRWEATGLSAEQITTLRNLQFEVADLPSLKLGEADGNHIRVSRNAGGNGWFISADKDDKQFGKSVSATRSYTDPISAPAGRVDLLTAIMHEMGHALGLPDTYDAKDRDKVMYGFLTKGERRVPATGDALGAKPGAHVGPQYLAAPVNIGDIPVGKTVVVTFSVQVENPLVPANTTQISNQGTVKGTNIIPDKLTDDPNTPAPNDPTVTQLTAPPVVAIHTIQGSGTTSPLNGTVVTTNGVVTGRRSNGFFLQEPDGAGVDADPNTSEGIFVFTSSAPPAAAVIGNNVQVTGTVQEFIPPSDPNSPPMTELITPTVVLNSTGNSLPAPITLTIADTAVNNVNNLEKFEGMRVHVNSLTVVEPTGGLINEVNATSASTGAFYGVITGVARPFIEPGIPTTSSVPPPNPANVPRFDTNPERLRVDSAAQTGSTAIEVTTGAVLTSLTGVLDYSFHTYTILPDAATPPTVTGNTLAATPLPVPTATQLTVASLNLQRFFDTTDDPAVSDVVLTATAFNNRLNKASLAVRNIMRTPDVIGVQEMENLTTLQALASKINNDAVAAAQPNPNYTAYLVEGNDTAGIDVGFLVKAAPRVTVIDVTQFGKTTTYINPNNNQPETLNDRPPLVLRGTVLDAGNQPFAFTVIVNHLRSLGGIDDPVNGNQVRTKRRAQAEYLANLVQARQVADSRERLIVLGDFNAYQFNDGYVDVIGTIRGTPTPSDQVVLASSDLVNPNLTNLVDGISAAERYSYSFGGNAQALDHIIVTGNLVSRVDQFVHARFDVDFPESFRNDANRAERISDHDAPVTYISLADLSANPSGTGGANPDPVDAGNTTLLTVTVTPAAGPPSTGLTVTGDLTSIGGSPTQTFFDDGSNGDVTIGDNIFSFSATVAPATPAGAKTLPTTISDAQARSGTANISLTVTTTSPPPSPTPTATATATPTATATATPTATATATPTATATATPTATATASPTPTATATATSTPTATATASPTPTATPTATAAQTLNISTRLRVDVGDKVMIAGFIITGNVAKPVVLRGMGPSLVSAGIPAASTLQDPVIELRGSNGALITSNDNWKDTQQAQIQGTIFQPTDDRESVILATLPPAAYTVILKGVNQTSGIGLVEVYDNNQAVDSDLANISSRGFVDTGNSVMIGGFTLGGSSNPTRIAVRALGPSLSNFGLANVLADPTLELHNADGTIMVSNDDWQSDPVSAGLLTANGLALPNPKEAGIFMSLAPPGQFTAIVAGKNGGIGIALVEIYNLK